MGTESLKLQCLGIEYKVNEEKKVVVAIQKFGIPLKVAYTYGIGTTFTTVGKAECGYMDTFDINLGKKIARAKAEKKAFITYKNVLLKVLAICQKDVYVLSNTINKMSTLINHQREYLKEF